MESAKHAHNQTCLRLSYDAKLTFACAGVSLALTTRMDGQAEGRRELLSLARVRKLFLYVTPLRRDGILSLSSSSSKDEERKGLMLTSEKNSLRPVSPNRGSPFPFLLACSRYVVNSSEMASERELYYVHTTSTRSCTDKQWQVPQPLPLALVAPIPTLR